jgi:hypothetical protein
VEFHDCVLMTVHRNRIRKMESLREMKPFLLHRFVPGMYAVDRTRLPKLLELLEESGFQPSKEPTMYPGDPEQSGARDRLQEMVTTAREASDDPSARAHAADTRPEDLHPVPGSQVRATRKKKRDLPPRVSPLESRQIIDRAVSLRQHLELLYMARDGKRVTCEVAPERLAINPAGDAVMVARDVARSERRTYKLTSIERLRAVERS